MPSKLDQDSKFTCEDGVIHLGGMEALVRLSLDQIRTDRRRGLRTGMFISGYRGSPIGMLDQQLLRRQALLLEHDIHFVDGLNEDLAATAVWGTQMLHAVGREKFDGVTGMWYGKAPGVDRSGDALKHANYTGIGKNGGVLAVVGDDPSCKSSSLPSQSEPMLYHVGIPSLNPSNIQEILDYGLHGYNLSRLAGLWIGLKLVTNVADSYGDANISPSRLKFITPSVEFDGRPFSPHMNLGMNVRAQALEMERSLYGPRLEMARRYAYENNLNAITLQNRDAWLGIMASGKTYNDLCESFDAMGLGEQQLLRCGIRVLKIGMLFPLEPRRLHEFAQGLEEILIIEEKRPFLEMFVKNILYGRANAPRIIGKFDEFDAPLLPHHGEFEPDTIGRAIASRLLKRQHVESVVAWLRKLDALASRESTPTAARTAWYCSGCPHSTSTRAPEGSIVSAGIGCHTMAMWMDRNVVMGTHMGAEGAQWIGMAPFTDTPHIFQNIGDGTYFHSGILAIRYAAAAGVNITYKLLYNAHVSMTGGQEAMGNHPVKDIAAELLAGGVRRIIVTTEELGRYAQVTLPAGSEVWDRNRIMEAQRLLAATPGTTVLIHDQECAAELRRMRGRKERPEPPTHVIINERVCEGCGDCGVKSNCMSVEPIDTEFGRKTRINESSCNKDYSCVTGFCPAFLTVTPATGAKRRPRRRDPLPVLRRELQLPQVKVPRDFSAHIMGIGGTGVVTVAQTIADAARLEGRFAIGIDQTGLAQKGGSVISDLKITSQPYNGAAKIADAAADLYLGFDILNATDRKNIDKCDPARTIAIISTSKSPTGFMVSNRHVQFPAIEVLTEGINQHSRRNDNLFLDAQFLASSLFGNNMAANPFMVGIAYQAGALPIEATSIEQAIREAGIASEMGVRAFQWGRMAVLDPEFVHSEVAQRNKPVAGDASVSGQSADILKSIGATGELHRLVTVRVNEIIAYQDPRYARRYAEAVRQAMLAEQRQVPGRDEFAKAVARNLFKLMAYKDEFEVARLHSDPAFLDQLSIQFGDDYKVQYHLAPPSLGGVDSESGEPRKRKFGGWIRPLFKVLAACRSLRGTVLDPFGRTVERGRERRLIETYIKTVDRISAGLGVRNHALAVAIAEIPDQIRGYGHVKTRSVEQACAKEQALLKEYLDSSDQAQPSRDLSESVSSF